MSESRPMFDVETHSGEASAPREAATVIVLRGGAETLELLLVRRTPRARFMAGAWVFPGGSVDASDGTGEAGLRAAAVRELGEEAGITLADPAALIAYSRWITPPQSRIRFDTWFFLATLPPGQTARVDGEEIVAARWETPGSALAAGRAGELSFAFPTIRHLEQLSGFASTDALLTHALGRTVVPVQPRVVGSQEQARIVLPGEPGYDG
jgi:8-oxo-dGTP pyrophosphatase MutT (NUDIX family)